MPIRGAHTSAPKPEWVYMSQQWEIDLGQRELRAYGAPVPIGNRAFEIISVLVQAAGKLVSKDDLMGRVWGAIVEENTIQVHISAIRKALGPDRGMLKTSSGRGYRLLGTWTIGQEEHASAEPISFEQIRKSVRPFQFALAGVRFDWPRRRCATLAESAVGISGGHADRTRRDWKDLAGAGGCPQPVPDL